MSALLASSFTSLAKPFLLLTFACTDASMQNCEVFQDRFSSIQECWNSALEINALNDSISLKHRNPKHSTVVTNCAELPEEDSELPYPSAQLRPLGF